MYIAELKLVSYSYYEYAAVEVLLYERIREEYGTLGRLICLEFNGIKYKLLTFSLSCGRMKLLLQII